MILSFINIRKVPRELLKTEGVNIRKVPREMLKTEGLTLGFQQLSRDLANVNEWKIMFDPYIISPSLFNNSLWTLRMLMNGKSYLIPIIINSFKPKVPQRNNAVCLEDRKSQYE